VLDVVELLTRAGGVPLRFSDVVRELDLTQATAHAILKTLCDRGWATRDPVTKTFTPGPALAVVAARTAAARPLLHAARAAAQAVSADVGLPASVVERVDDVLVISAFEGGDARHPAGIPGDRIPYAPPFGVAFAAWDTDDGARTWMRRAGATQPSVETRLTELLARTRERGYDVDWTTPALAQTAQLVGTLREDRLPARVAAILEQLLVEFTTIGMLTDDDPARASQPVATIAAPVFGQRGTVELIVSVHPFRALSAPEIDAMGSRLTAETARLSAAARTEAW
jgi:DNA-binding IclR family transcriptional regulator